jgi:hypothetical protein
MTAQDLLEAAYKANPDLLEKTANALFVLERWEPSFAAELAKDISTIANVTMEKTARMGDMALKGAIAGVGALGVGVAGAMAGDLYDAAKRGLTKGNNLKRIMENNPELKRGDRKALLRSFNTLHRYAPDFTSDPMLGGQILNRMIELPNDQLNLVKDLLASRKTLSDSKKNQFALGKFDMGKG